MSSKMYAKKVVLVALYVLLAFWIVFIFYNSSLCADDSNASSGVFVRFFVEKIMRLDFEGANENTIAFVTKVIRKLAHFTEYAILASLSFLILFLHGKKLWLCAVAPTSFCALVAVLDEYSQRFASGRSPQMSDVLIDTAGGLFASLILIVLILIISKFNKNVRENERI